MNEQSVESTGNSAQNAPESPNETQAETTPVATAESPAEVKPAGKKRKPQSKRKPKVKPTTTTTTTTTTADDETPEETEQVKARFAAGKLPKRAIAAAISLGFKRSLSSAQMCSAYVIACELARKPAPARAEVLAYVNSALAALGGELTNAGRVSNHFARPSKNSDERYKWRIDDGGYRLSAWGRKLAGLPKLGTADDSDESEGESADE